MWSWQDRAESISYGELKALRMMLTNLDRTRQNSFHSQIDRAGISHVRWWCHNLLSAYVKNPIVTASRPVMRELRLVKRELRSLGIHISSKWLQSVLNIYADRLSRRFPSGDLHVRNWLRQSVLDGAVAPIDAFPYRPLGETQYFWLKKTLQQLRSRWDVTEVRLLCPPVDLIQDAVAKLRAMGAPAMFLIPDWPRQP